MQDQNNKTIFPPNDAPPSAGTLPTNSISAPQVPTPVQQEPAPVPVEPVAPMPVQNEVVDAPILENPVPVSTVVEPMSAPQPVIPPTEAPVQVSETLPIAAVQQVEPESAVVAPQPVSEPVMTAPDPVLPSSIVEPQLSTVMTPPTPPSMPQPMAVPAVSVAPAFKKKNNFLKFLLLGAAILFVLAGIGFAVMQFMGNGTGSAVGTKGQITWWGYQLDEETVAPLIQEYESQNSGVKITYVKQSKQDYRERLTNALAKGEGPDIFEIHNSWPAMFKNDLSVLPASVMTPDQYKGSFYPVITQDMTTQKGIVGMPLSYDAITLYVNEDIFSAALRTPPKTWIDVQGLADPARGIAQKDQSGRIIQSAVALGTTENVEYWPEIFGLMMYQNKANFVTLDSNTAKDVVSFYQYFGRTTGNWDTTLPNSVEAFAKQKTAMVFAPSESAFTIIQQAPNLRFKTYPLPQLPKENPNDPDFSYATYWVEGVWERSASKEESWKFLKYMSSGETLQKLNQNLKNGSKTQRAYPIPSLNQQYINDPILGSIVALADSAKSWYLADKTNDGTTGLNTQLKNAYAKVFANDPKTAQSEITKILTQYGIPLPK